MKLTPVFALILCASSTLAAQKAYVYASTGKPVIESATGIPDKAHYGSSLAYDEILITGAEGTASLMLEGTRIKAEKESVLAFLFSGTGTDPHPAFVPAAGIISFSFPGTDSTPVAVIACGNRIRASCAAFTVYTAIDGSALVSVTEGFVDMVRETGTESVRVSAGESAELNYDTAEGTAAVRIRHPDEPAFDFNAWNDQKTDSFTDDPLAVLEKAGSLAKTQDDLYAQLGEPYAQSTDAWKQAADEYRTALASGDEETISDVRTKKLFPAQDKRLRILNEMRFHGRMALIVRRFTLERLLAQTPAATGP